MNQRFELRQELIIVTGMVISKDSLIVILTGAGISAESGLKTFRDMDGLWETHRIEDVATPEAFERNPELVQDFYNQRRRQLFTSSIQPNAAHQALARLESLWPGKVCIVTQNIDNLHERAGSKNILHMHGELTKVKCLQCHRGSDWQMDVTKASVCPLCSKAGSLRPDIVWFGEIPYHLDEIDELLRTCGLFVSIGTSGAVYPAAGFVAEVRAHGLAQTIEINKEASEVRQLFNESRLGLASHLVPRLVDEILGETKDQGAQPKA
jgi:NAD-dependent deacetylase